MTLNFEYAGNPTTMTLRKNGEIVFAGAPSSYGLYGSLDNMISDPILSVTMCNAGGCSDDYAEVHRTTTRPRAWGSVTAQWQDLVPIDPYEFTINVGYENYTRILDGEFFHADYSVSTAGPRNGYSKHVQSADALLWESGKREPLWEVEYQMMPSWSWTTSRERAFESAGCYVSAPFQLPNQSPQCTVIGEFGRPGTPGSGVILSVIAIGSGFGAPSAAEGDLVLDVGP